MSTLQVTTNNGLATIMLDRGRSNAMNHEMILDLSAAVQQLANDEAIGGVIITGKPGFFSSGIDLIEAYSYDEKQSRTFWIDFLALQKTLVSFKKPMIAAISGHSPAGGCVLAICCDYRVMAEGAFIIGLNEIPVGIVVPESIFNVYAFWIGQRKAYQYLLEGKLLKVDEAFEAGLIDEVCNAENLLPIAQKKARTLMSFNPVTWSQSKLNLRKELISNSATDSTETLDQMLKQWWAPATRQGLEMMIQNLKSRSTAKSA